MTESANLTFSVIVASWERPRWLKRCLTALRQLDHPAFEVVVVADQASLASIDACGMKTVVTGRANLSAARNLGAVLADGDVCVFIDDDAMPEPFWLKHHQAAFGITGVAASVGYVRGRNGISFQSRVASIDREAETHHENSSDDDPFIPLLASGRAVKLIGTNMAVRREILCGLGGFDEDFSYFLEDGDFSLRLLAAGYNSAVAPLAEVHHAFASSVRRTAQRAPTDLYDIGRSSAIFFRKHPGGDLVELYQRIINRERSRLLRHMVQGTCEPRDTTTVMQSLDAGWQAGLGKKLASPCALEVAGTGFQPLPEIKAEHIVESSRLLKRRKALVKAQAAAKAGKRVSLFSFSLTSVRHNVRYDDDGVWIQSGGQFGRSDREDSAFRWCRFAARKKDEVRRVAKVRGI